MKILKITLQNINSLQSEKPFVIDFESDYFKDVGLYAITGSTGAGKTTILDAITIALYHKVPRFRTNSKATLVEVVSQGASAALAQVVFENNNETYEAHWTLKVKNAKGILKKPQEVVRLKNLTTNTILCDKKSDVAKAIVEITQLTYKQFLRSSMLAQGEFSAFLSAPSKDKGALLEQITGEEIYKRIGEEVGDRIRAEKNRLTEIKAKINSDDILTEDYRKELENDLVNMAQEEEKLQVKLQQNEEKIRLYERVKNIQKDQEEISKNNTELENFIQKHKTHFDQLEKHKLAFPFKENITEMDRLSQEIKEQKSKFEELIRKSEGVSKTVERLKQEQENTKKSLGDAEQEYAKWMPIIDSIVKMDNELILLQKTKNEYETNAKDVLLNIVEIERDKESHLNQNKSLKSEILAIDIAINQSKNLLEIESKLTDWSGMFVQLESNKINLKKWQKNIRKLLLELKQSEESLQRGKTILGEEKRKQEKLVSDFEQLEKKLRKLNAEQLIREKDKTLEIKTNLREGLRISKEFSGLNKTKIELGKEIKILDDKETEFKAFLLQLDNELTQAKTSLKDVETILEQERTIKSLEEERNKLQEGEPCQLCGSKDHPLIEHYQKLEPSATIKRVVKNKQIVDDLTARVTIMETKRAQAITKHNLLEKQLEEIDQAIDGLNSQFKELNLEATITQAEELNAVEKSLENQLIKLNTDVIRAQKQQKEKENLFKLVSDKKQEVDKISNQINILEERIKRKKEEHVDLLKKIQDTEVQSKNWEDELKVAFDEIKIPFPSENEYVSFLETKKTEILEYREKLNQKIKFEGNLKVLEAELKNLNQRLLKEYETKAIIVEKSKENENKINALLDERKSLLPLEIKPQQKRETLEEVKGKAKMHFEKLTKEWQEQEKLKVALQAEIEGVKTNRKKTQENLDKIENTTKEKIATSIFHSVEDIKKALLDENVYLGFKKLKQDAEESRIRIHEKRKQLAKLEEEATNLSMEKWSNDKLIQDKETWDNQLKKILEDKGGKREKLKKDDEVQARNSKVYHEITSQEKNLKKWTDLNMVLGNSRDSFNVYVQRLTLSQLIQMANIHLYKLNKRYSLQLPEKYKAGEELNFHLIDHYRTDLARLVDTSSGGERFIISLALALGLSDLSSQNVNIDSLFIDEGFGSLDQNTLETVISTLETLQSQGKMIGVISHVENLKERISTQIKVIKKSNGVSRIEVG